MAEQSDLVGEVGEVVREHASRPPKQEPVSLASARRDRDKARRTEALAMRMAGLSHDQIGERLGISTDGARDMINRTLARAESRVVEAEREIENARLDRAQAAIWSRVLDGDLKAIDSFLRLSQRRAKMNGLDAPTKIDLSVGVRQEMEQALSELHRVVLGEVIHVAHEPESIAINPD